MKAPPIIGDDIESQVGATIVPRTLVRLVGDRGVKLERMKSPARQHTDNDARRLTEEFISTYGRGSAEPSDRRAAAAQD